MRRSSALIVAVLAIGSLAVATYAAAQQGDDASPNITHLANSPKPGTGDLAFWSGAPLRGRHRDLAFVAHYDGFRIVDIGIPSEPELVTDFHCRGVQGDNSVFKARNRLLYVQSVDGAVTGLDCATAEDVPPGYTGPRFEGLRVFDVTNPQTPVHLASVPTRCGSHTHTAIPDEDDQRMIVYVSSNPSRFGTPSCPQPHAKISIVEIPYANPATARLLKEQPLHFDTQEHFHPGGISAGVACHEITAFLHPTRPVAFASCQSEGQLWDISDPANPSTLGAHTHIDHPAVQYWHSSTFTWDGKVLAVSDETALGLCDGSADSNGHMWFFGVVEPGAPNAPLLGSYTPERPHTGWCFGHQANVVPTDEGYVGVVGTWAGGTSVFDFTDPANAREIAHYDPSGADGNGAPETWSAYWYNDRIYASDHQRGLDVYALRDDDGRPYRARHWNHLNPQTQEPFQAVGLGP